MKKHASILFCNVTLVAILFSFYGFSLAKELQSEVKQLLQQCLNSPDAMPVQAIGALQLAVDRNDAVIRDLFFQEAVRIGGGGGKGLAFQKKVFEAIDRRQFQLVDELALQVVAEMGDGVDLAIRTGTSGSRHMQLHGKLPHAIRYDALVSADEIIFIGIRAEEASVKFTSMKKNKGLANARISAISLPSITNATSGNLHGQQSQDPRVILDSAETGTIRQELVEKGAVIFLIRRDTEILPVAQPIQSMVLRPAAGAGQDPPNDGRAQSRPGYRAQPTSNSMGIYRYIMDKTSRGEDISAVEAMLIRRMIANRTWPEAPEITARARAIQEWALRQPEDAHLFTDPENWSRGLVSDATYEQLVAAGLTDADVPHIEASERFRSYWHSLRPEQQEALPLGRWMRNYFASLGYDMRSDEQRMRDEVFANEQARLHAAGLKQQAEAERQRKEDAEAEERKRQKWFEDNWAEEDRRIARGQAELDRAWAEYVTFFERLSPEDRALALEEMTAEQREALAQRLVDANTPVSAHEDAAGGPDPLPVASSTASESGVADSPASVVLPADHHARPPQTGAAVGAPNEQSVNGSTIQIPAASEDLPGPGAESRSPAVGPETSDPVNITVTAPAIWPGVVNDTGLHLKRQDAKGGATHEMCPYAASVWAEVSGKINPSFAPRTVEEIRAKFEQDKLTHDKWGRTVNIRPFSIGDYQGLMLESTMRYLRGGWSGDGYRDSGVEALGHAIVTKGGRTIELTYGIGSGGCWDNSQRAFQESQAAAAIAEAQAILAGIRLSEQPALVQTPYTGPKLDGSDLPVVRLRPDTMPILKVGENFTVEAVVENAKPADAPFSYEWTGTHGNADDQKSAVASILAGEPGKHTVTVSVGGQRHHLGSASLEYTVAEYKVRVERDPSHAGPVSVGTKVGFVAKVTVDGQNASGNFTYRWQPHPEVSFNKLDAQSPDVSAVFVKPGAVGVWVEVLEKRGETLVTVAESDQVQIEVVAPELSLTFEPQAPLVGQEIKARVVVKPEFKELDLRWLPLPFNAHQGVLSQDRREMAMYLKDDKPAQVTIMARVPVSGEALGMIQGSIGARKYAVIVTGPKAMGPPPQVWKEGVGLVTVEKAIAAHQIVEFSASVQPEAVTGPLTYQWTVLSGACSISNPLYRDVRVTASQVGTCQLEVIIRDRNRVELGRGQGGFSATVNTDMDSGGKPTASSAEEATVMVQSAKEKATTGDYEGAIAAAESAAGVDPANTEAKPLAQRLRQDKETMDRQLDKARSLMDDNRFAEAQKELGVATNVSNAYKAALDLDQELKNRWSKYDQEVRKMVAEVRSLNENKDFAKALATATAWRAKVKLDANADKELKTEEDGASKGLAQKEGSAWKLVEIIDYENKESWPSSDADFWKFTINYAREKYTAKIYSSNAQAYTAYGVSASWSKPPDTIKPGDQITLDAILSETENTHRVNMSAASTYADFASPERGLGQRGDIAFVNSNSASDISINGASDSLVSSSFSAQLHKGVDGERIALRIVFYMGGTMSTYYVYEWH